jgi:ribonuclease-3
MHKRLKWNAVGLDRKTQILYEKMLIEKQQEPPENLKNLRKLQLFIDELKFLLDIMNKIHNELILELEKILRVKFKTPELIMLALSRPSIRNIYEDLEIYFNTQQDNPLKPEDYKELASSGDAADVLALIGDSVLDLGTVQLLWDSSLATAGELTKRRADLVANENLAKVCEKWNLYDYRLKRLNVPSELNAKVKTIEHEKATLVEAIYGVIYLEFGYDELIRTLAFIQ